MADLQSETPTGDIVFLCCFKLGSYTHPGRQTSPFTGPERCSQRSVKTLYTEEYELHLGAYLNHPSPQAWEYRSQAIKEAPLG